MKPVRWRQRLLQSELGGRPAGSWLCPERAGSGRSLP